MKGIMDDGEKDKDKDKDKYDSCNVVAGEGVGLMETVKLNGQGEGVNQYMVLMRILYNLLGIDDWR